MPVPTEELKLEIVHAATGKSLGAGTAPGADGALVVRDRHGGPFAPAHWQFVPVPAAGDGAPQDEPTYVIRNAVSGQVLGSPTTAGGAVGQEDAAAGKKTQQWHVVPVDGETGLFFIEGVTDRTVLDLVDNADLADTDTHNTQATYGTYGTHSTHSTHGTPSAQDTQIVLREYDEDAESQRWRLVPAEPERTSDPVLGWCSLSHWNSRRSWRLAPSPALRPVPGAAPSFSDMLLVLPRFGSDEDAGEWKIEGPVPPPVPLLGGQPHWWAGIGARFLADTTGAGRQDIVALQPAKGAVTSSSRGDGTFDDDARVLHPPAPSASPADLWTLADMAGDGRPDVVVLAADGVQVHPQGEDGTFAPGTTVVEAFGHGEAAGAWRADEHPRFLADTTGDGRLDIVGCHDDGVWISLQNEDGTFAPLGDEPALRAFGHAEEAGAWRPDRHPRFLADTTGDGRLDIVGCHEDGVWVSLQGEDGAFAEPHYVRDGFGGEQGWTSAREHPRFLTALTGTGPADIIGFGPQGVTVSRAQGDGTFAPSHLVLNDFGTAQGWTSAKHLRLLADVTGDGTPDIVGFGDAGVWVSHHLGDGRFEQAQLVCRGFGHHRAAGGWRVDRHPRYLADVTGDGRVDIVGFGGPGVYVARNLFRGFRTR